MYTVPSSMALHHFTTDLFLDFVPQSTRMEASVHRQLGAVDHGTLVAEEEENSVHYYFVHCVNISSLPQSHSATQSTRASYSSSYVLLSPFAKALLLEKVTPELKDLSAAIFSIMPPSSRARTPS